MRVFLTGGTGFLGGALARLLLAEGHAVVALVRRPEAAAGLRRAGAELRAGDVTLPETVMAGMRGCDAVAHVAGWYRVGVLDARTAQAVNVDDTRHVLTAMRDLGVPRGVYTSTVMVHSDTRGELADEDRPPPRRPLSVYEATKAEAHAIAREFAVAGLPLVLLMPGAIYGPGDASELHATLHGVLRGRVPLLPRRTAYCWSHVDDVARGHLLALQRGRAGADYHLTGQVATLLAAMTRAAELAGRRPPRAVPPELLRAAAPAMDVLDKFLPLPPTYAGETLRISAGATFLGSAAKAERELGWRARDFWPSWDEHVRAEWQALGGGSEATIRA